MAEDIIIGSKTNGVVKLEVGKYLFSFRKRKKGIAEFKREETVDIYGGKQKVQTEYKKWLKEKEQEYANFLENPDKDKSAERLTFKQLTNDPENYWQAWVNDDNDVKYKRGSRKNLLDNMRYINENHKWFTSKEISMIEQKHCTELLDKLKKDKNMKVNTLQKYKQTISSLFIYVQDKLIKGFENPTIGIKTGYQSNKRVRQAKKTKNILRGSDIDLVVKRIEDGKDFPLEVFVKTILGTAMRRGEMYALEWKNIRFDDNYIEVKKTMIEYEGGWELTDSTKNGTERVAPLLNSVKSLLQKYKEYCKEKDYGTCFDKNGIEHNFIFKKKNGEPYQLRRFSKEFKKHIDNLNNEGLLEKTPTLHDLRGTAITRFLIDKHVEMPIVQDIAGHTDSAVTIDYYVEVEKEDIIKLADRLKFTDGKSY